MEENLDEIMYVDRKVFCKFCAGERNHKIIYTYKENADMYEVADDREYFQWHAKYHIIKCAGCDTVAFLRQYGDEDTWDIINGEREWIDIYTVYPEEPVKLSRDDPFFDYFKLEVKNYNYVPENIKRLYKQIVESYNNKHFILSTSGLRTLVEGICSQLGIKKGYMYDRQKNVISINEDKNKFKTDSLAGRIFGLYEKELILFTQALILQEIKDIGNSATHDIVVPDFEDIREIIIILEKVLYDIYEMKKHTLLIEGV
ncbi:DUF4145 domain-containing protein [Planococcus sp. SIMBA_143]